MNITLFRNSTIRHISTIVILAATGIMAESAVSDVTSDIQPDFYFFDRLPQWLLFLILTSASILAIEAGQQLGRWRSKKGREPEGPMGTVVAAVLALLAFVIALTFSAAGNRYDDRKMALLNEVNTIGTAYLRAGLMPEPQGSTVQHLLVDYVKVRLSMFRAFDEDSLMQDLKDRTQEIQAAIWAEVTSLVKEGNDSPVTALFISAINDVFDSHTKRVVLGVEYRIPPFVWYTLCLVSILAMGAVGYHFGMGGRKSLVASITLSISFSLVILLIYDFDRPGEGVIEVNQQPMLELYQSLQDTT